MKIVTIIGVAALAGATLAFTATLPMQDAKAKSRGDEKKAEKAAPDAAAMQAAFEQAAAPGKQHAELAKTAGTWTTHMKHYSAPDAPPMESDGTSKIEPILGGRYMVERFESDMPMMGRFEGMGISGYDNVTQQYVATWIDNMGTGVMITRGNRNAEGVLEMRGEYDDALGQGKIPMREVLKEVSPNERHFTMYETRDGVERKLFDLVYTRGQSAGQGEGQGKAR
jgi:hypothetical protein